MAELKALNITRQSVLDDYRIVCASRRASIVGRKEVFTGKAKFGIFGDGKEVPQVALARAFRTGDVRSGYYRDQTFMLAKELLTLEAFFAQLYAHADVEADPSSAGRSMNGHFGTRTLDPDGNWLPLARLAWSSGDVSPTGSQMPRLVGLGYASRLYREIEALHAFDEFSRAGEEIAFGTIGNASCAEGMFWEALNAIGVLRAAVLLSIWDDGYGISVPNEHQISGGDISALLRGFQREPGRDGFDVHRVRGWDYAALCETYLGAADIVRREHVPAVVHVVELTQPQGHSTSGSHERYKSAERLRWEEEHDCITKMREWMIAEGMAKAAELERIEREESARVEEAKSRAWKAFQGPILEERERLISLFEAARERAEARTELDALREGLRRMAAPLRRDLMRAAHDALIALRAEPPGTRAAIRGWLREQEAANRERYGSHLHSESACAALAVPVVEPRYAPGASLVRGFEVLNACFDAALARDPRIIAFGEDVGKLGDVNQGFSGLQDKYGELRVSDTGIRECTLVGQAIGMAMRGLRPIVEIQYLDYLLYALQILSDDLATLHYRTRGGQKAPLILRTRGHRLEGIWHSGSPMGGVAHLIRGVYLCVPRDMTRAAGFYNTLLRSDDPGIVIEVLNGYRLREPLPDNVGELTVPLGVPEVLRAGTDATVVTYGALCRIALEAAEQLATLGAEVEVIDVQTLLPFDREGRIVESLKKTARVLFLDEDVPGGGTAYMMQQVLDAQGGWCWLDSAPRALSAAEHRPAYGSDGDYFSKPNREQIMRAVYELLHEADPARWPRWD